MESKKIWDVFVYGDLNIDLIIPGVQQLPPGGEEWEVPVMKTLPGGGAALFALGLGKLGLKPVFQGALGADFYGGFLQKELKSKGVDTSLIETDTKLGTGISISFTNEKDRSFLTYRGTTQYLNISQIRKEEVLKARHIHVTGYAGSENHRNYLAFLKEIKETTDTTISFDIGWDSTGEWTKDIYELFPFLDILFMNETESVHYSRKKTAREAAEDFAVHCKTAVIKLGKKGSLAVKQGQYFEQASYPITAVDTTGAGDSFNAGYIYGFMKGKSVQDSLRCGNGCGALSCTALGGNSAFPDEKTLWNFIDSMERKVK